MYVYDFYCGVVGVFGERVYMLVIYGGRVMVLFVKRVWIDRNLG